MPKILSNYVQNVENGLAHVGSHWEGHKNDELTYLSHISQNTGSPLGCMRLLESLASASTLLAWFSGHDLVHCKQWAYVSAKLRRIIYQKAPLTGIYSPGVPFSDMFMPLLSDHPGLIRWYGEFEGIDLERAKKGGTWEFVTHQAKLALRGEWDLLGERSERWLSNVPERMKRFAPDNRFHLALAKHDIAGMESALAEIVTPKEVKWRNEHEGFTGWFIVRQAVIYAKIAWRHGFQVQVDTPWIPKEWLPIEPLPAYEDPYPFMQAFDIETPVPKVPIP